MEREKSLLKEAFENKEFAVTVELVPGRGSREKWFDKLMEFAEQAETSGRITAISITDHPSGISSMSPIGIAEKLVKMENLEPMVHISAKDLSRNGTEGYLYALDKMGVRNVFLITGDFPTTGFNGLSRPVFDLDSIWMTRLASELNGGLADKKSRKSGNWLHLKPTQFLKGVAVSPFKNTEEELYMQYWKLNKKILAGADYVIPQLGYDMRKFDELLRVLRSSEIHIPVLANVYVPTLGAAKFLNRGEIPGAYLSDDLLATMTEDSKESDKGKSARLSRAAKMVAVLRGLGYDGVHLGGHGLQYLDVVDILNEAESYRKNWRQVIQEVNFPDPNAYYLFEEDKQTGLNSERLVAPKVKRHFSPGYTMFALGHYFLFRQESLAYKALRPIFKGVKRNGVIESMIDFSERVIKSAVNHCRQCGDCALPQVAFLCPTSQCPKIQRNGPCGGSRDGWCEVFPEVRKCVWVRAYHRVGGAKAEEFFADAVMPPRNHDLDLTPSWVNFYAEKDHAANYGLSGDEKPPSVFDTPKQAEQEETPAKE